MRKLPQPISKEEHLYKTFELGRFLVIMIIAFSMINILGLYSNLEGIDIFLKSFNLTIFISLGLLVCWLDWKKYKIIYGEKK